MNERERRAWPGFWNRFIGFFIDSLVLGLIGLAIGACADDRLSAVGAPARLIGFAIGMLYFSILSSGFGGSRTLGMRLMGLKVVRLNGRPIGFTVAVVRAFVLQAPLILNGLSVTFANPLLATAFTVVSVIAVFGVTLAQIYLLLFNSPSRRLLHDIVTGSAVVNADVREIPPPKSRVHGFVALAIILASCGLVMALPTLLAGLVTQNQAVLGKLETPWHRLQAMPEVMSASLQDNTFSMAGRQPVRTLIVTVRLRHWPANQNQEITRVGQVVAQSYSLAPGQGIRVTLTHGFDLGIASRWESHSADYSAATPDTPTNWSSTSSVMIW